MSQSIENILIKPDTKKATEYNIITTMSTEANKGHHLLKNTILGGGNKNTKIKKKEILNNNQITNAGQAREKKAIETRINLKIQP